MSIKLPTVVPVVGIIVFFAAGLSAMLYFLGQSTYEDSAARSTNDWPETDVGCNGVDNDHDGMVDEGFAPWGTTCGQGACLSSGEVVCQNGTLVDTCIAGKPAPEVMNGSDDNCNGVTDEGPTTPTNIR